MVQDVCISLLCILVFFVLFIQIIEHPVHEYPKAFVQVMQDVKKFTNMLVFIPKGWCLTPAWVGTWIIVYTFGCPTHEREYSWKRSAIEIPQFNF